MTTRGQKSKAAPVETPPPPSNSNEELSKAQRLALYKEFKTAMLRKEKEEAQDIAKAAEQARVGNEGNRKGEEVEKAVGAAKDGEEVEEAVEAAKDGKEVEEAVEAANQAGTHNSVHREDDDEVEEVDALMHTMPQDQNTEALDNKQSSSKVNIPCTELCSNRCLCSD